MKTVQYTAYAQEIIFGPGSLGQLSDALKRFGWQRLMLCTGPALRANGHAAAVEAALGNCLAAVFDRVQPHVQDEQVDEVVNLAVEKQIQAVVGLGGGSPIGMAKAVSLALEERLGGGTPQPSSPIRQPQFPVIAIPTTYAGSEMTAVYGITHSRETPPRKVTVSDPRIAPKLVLYDPELTLDLPPELTASSGMNALAHCVEALYSVTRNPLSGAAALAGIQHLFPALPRGYAHGEDLEARTELLVGAHLAGFSLASVKMGLHHGLCHVLGGTLGVPHGIANSIILPYAVRFNAEACAPQLLPAAEVMHGSSGSAAGTVTLNSDPAAGQRSPSAAIEAMVQQIFDLTSQMNLPQRLRDVGVKESDLPRLAQLAFQNHTIQNNPRPVTGPKELEKLLQEAW